MTTRKLQACVVEALQGINWGKLGVKAVILHGSLVYSSHVPRDADIVLLATRRLSLDEETIIAESVEERCGIEADLAIVYYDDPDCSLLLTALQRGELVHVDRDSLVLARTIMLCYDFLISEKKTRYVETLVERALSIAPGWALRDCCRACC